MTTTSAEHPPTGGRLLRIVAGLHAGASRELAEREMILVGSGDDCDIVLADEGVAAHHALISVVDGSFHLRALDAPLKLEGRVLHPGDPVEMDGLQRVGLGDAALAFGLEDDPAWLGLAPEGDIVPASRARGGGIPFTRRLPMIAAIAVLSLASLAIFAAVMPSGEPAVDPEARLKALVRGLPISELEIARDVNGQLVLSGMVHDAASRDRLREQLAGEDLQVSLALRTGEDLALNVAEVLRAGGYPARTRYLGHGNVEVTGRFEDMDAFEAFVRTPAVVGTGVNQVVPVNLADPVPGEAPAEDQDEVRIVAYERGDDPHVIDEHGRVYRAGDHIPGWGVLAGTGQHAQAIAPDGTLRRIVPQPIRAEEMAPSEAEPQTEQAGAPAQETPRSRAYAAEQSRAAAQRR